MRPIIICIFEKCHKSLDDSIYFSARLEVSIECSVAESSVLIGSFFRHIDVKQKPFISCRLVHAFNNNDKILITAKVINNPPNDSIPNAVDASGISGQICFINHF
jgi:hypothetical protein